MLNTPAPNAAAAFTVATTFDDLDDLDTAPVNDARPGYLAHAAEYASRPQRRRPAPSASAPRIAQLTIEQKLEQFTADNPEVVKWVMGSITFEFAVSLAQSLAKFGSLTENQMGAVHKCMARDVDRAAQREAAKVSVTGEGLNKIGAALARAKAKGLKNPALVFDSVCFKAAKAASPNAGSLYVTSGRKFESVYFGKIDAAGVFHPQYQCPDEIKAEVARICRDPLAEIVAHGRRTGNCACCNRPLTDKASIARGIGPVCLEKFFGGGQ